MSEQNAFFAFLDHEFVLILKSKNAEDDWKVSELREVERRGKSILAGEPGLEKKFAEYESSLTDELEKIEAKIDISSSESENVSELKSYASITEIPSLDTLAASQSAIYAMQKRAIEITSIVTNSTYSNSIEESQSAISAMNKQAAEIASFVTTSVNFSAIKASQSAISAMTKQAAEIANMATNAVAISFSKTTLNQIFDKSEVIDVARRSAEIFARIPTQLSMSHSVFFATARKEPMSLLPASSNDLEISGVISSKEYENSVTSEYESQQNRVVEIVLSTNAETIRMREEIERSNRLQEETNNLVIKGSSWKSPLIVMTFLLLLITLVIALEGFFPLSK